MAIVGRKADGGEHRRPDGRLDESCAKGEEQMIDLLVEFSVAISLLAVIGGMAWAVIEILRR